LTPYRPDARKGQTNTRGNNREKTRKNEKKWRSHEQRGTMGRWVSQTEKDLIIADRKGNRLQPTGNGSGIREKLKRQGANQRRFRTADTCSALSLAIGWTMSQLEKGEGGSGGRGFHHGKKDCKKKSRSKSPNAAGCHSIRECGMIKTQGEAKRRPRCRKRWSAD